jgi:hypothetical protein
MQRNRLAAFEQPDWAFVTVNTRSYRRMWSTPLAEPLAESLDCAVQCEPIVLLQNCSIKRHPEADRRKNEETGSLSVSIHGQFPKLDCQTVLASRAWLGDLTSTNE